MKIGDQVVVVKGNRRPLPNPIKEGMTGTLVVNDDAYFEDSHEGDLENTEGGADGWGWFREDSGTLPIESLWVEEMLLEPLVTEDDVSAAIKSIIAGTP